MTRNSNFGSISTDHLVWIGHEKWDGHANQSEYNEADLEKKNSEKHAAVRSNEIINTDIGSISNCSDSNQFSLGVTHVEDRNLPELAWSKKNVP